MVAIEASAASYRELYCGVLALTEKKTGAEIAPLGELFACP